MKTTGKVTGIVSNLVTVEANGMCLRTKSATSPQEAQSSWPRSSR